MNNILTFFLLLTCRVCFGQNLVLNPDFETTNISCSGAIYENLTNWYNTDICSTPDRYSTCYVPQFMWGAPSNGQGNQAPHSGTAYGGFISYALGVSNYREYVAGTLSSALVAGQTYCVSFYISLSDKSPIAVNRLGVYFSNITILNVISVCQNASTTLPYTPQLQAVSVISDKSDWVLVQWQYVATGGESYFAIGNFYNDVQTTTASVSGGLSEFAYYYIDDVSVSTDTTNCNIALGLQEQKNVYVSLFPNPFSNQITFSLAVNEPATVSLFNFLGQQILHQTFTNTTTINTEQMQDGIYFYELRSNKGTIKTGRIIKH